MAGRRPWLLRLWERIELYGSLLFVAAILAFAVYQAGNPVNARILLETITNTFIAFVNLAFSLPYAGIVFSVGVVVVFVGFVLGTLFLVYEQVKKYYYEWRNIDPLTGDQY